ncbi:MAG: galactosyltransferase-related protein [Acidobacteriota bacterium]|nr:galactosyltransferase-related protein [Acidobacteriota bacterium]
MPEQAPLSVIIPWADRPELAETLRANRDIFRRHAAALIVVNCGGSSETVRALLHRNAPVPVTLVDLPDVPFNKSFALNHGVARASTDTVFLLDTDIILHADFLTQAHPPAPDSFITVDRVLESKRQPGTPQHLRAITHSISFVDHMGRKVHLDTNRLDLIDGSRSAPGLILLARNHFLAVDGMNAGLEGWGWEDLDLVARLQFELNLTHRRAGTVTHLSHGDELRDTRGQKPAQTESANFNRCLAAYTLGYFLGSYEEDLEEAEPNIVYFPIANE